jgi:hypothetical protein
MPVPKYYSSETDFEKIHQSLKHFPCPYCHYIGFLILHGFLSGFDETTYGSKNKRGHRIFCSNRKNRCGCGKTCSILLSGFLKHGTVTSHSAWRYLKGIASGLHKAAAFGSIGIPGSRSSPYNLWRRLRANLTHIRTSLLSITPPPDADTRIPEMQTIAHLQKAFPLSNCPVTEFQQHLQVGFFIFVPPKSGVLRL